ncbi:hypothetical protein [Dysgonomonas sp. GY617]|uniref:hypothetical protein n=1 Tax=Dysgonomonas sp. GY617 TaxID=2780420 RepID=UPI0018839EF1|nr:hypothetical protein [Dysgonomonas sp. GY617]MBF0576004.1 hypothetical protein [Dysgonomonas sp. GY617]
MKKTLILAVILLCFVLPASSQVGINTQSPIGIFHIDPQSNSATITTDDVVVTQAGNVGIGTVSPQAKLHLNVSSSQTALRIEDGNEKADRVLVSTDATGGAGWGAIKGSGGETLISTVSQSFPTSGGTLYLTGNNTRYKVVGAGHYLVYFRWWGKSTTVSNSRTSAYIRLLKNGTVVDTVEYYVATEANSAFSLAVALMATCILDDYLEITITPAATWTSSVSPTYTRVSSTFFLM